MQLLIDNVNSANKMDSYIPWTLVVISAPVMAFKQYVNVVQIVKASQWLAQGDLEAREAQGLPEKKEQ